MSFEERTVVYDDGGLVCHGLMVRDKSRPQPRPGILLFPDARGIGDTAKGCARRLADCGFVVLIADLYGQGMFTADIPRAHELMTALRSDVELWRQRGRAALEALAGQPAVDATRLAAIGYCFGGTTALELGRSGAELAAIVSFHGGLASPRPQDAANIKARVLACHGGADPVVLPTQVTEFASHMTRATVDWALEVYAGALHSFTHTELAGAGVPGHAYDARADERSWRAMTELLGDVFGNYELR
jgi:dienelactone hydrolase